ncbi:MAG TPA: enoyl-CoA hydratase-related protein, partial [Gemmatimonadales bacterium]|nr:enoyl-CoA hydratase-related protein [Gemmatimonadales bacterium]
MPEIAVSRDGHVVSLTLPAAPSHAAWTELAAAAGALRDDDSASVVLVAADGDFGLAAPDDRIAAGDILRGIELLPRPVIAVIEGAATGAGLALALASDVRIAGERASFAAGAAAAELLGLGITQRLPRLAGR